MSLNAKAITRANNEFKKLEAEEEAQFGPSKLTSHYSSEEDDCPRLLAHLARTNYSVNKAIFWIFLIILGSLCMLCFFNPIFGMLPFLPMFFGAGFFATLGLTILLKSFESYNKIKIDWELNSMGSWWGDYIFLLKKGLVVGTCIAGLAFSLVMACSYISAYMSKDAPNLIFAIGGFATFTPYVFIGLFILQSLADFIEIAKNENIETNKKALRGIYILTLDALVSLFLLSSFGILALSGAGNIVLFGFVMVFALITCLHKYHEAFNQVQPIDNDSNNSYIKSSDSNNVYPTNSPTTNSENSPTTNSDSTPIAHPSSNPVAAQQLAGAFHDLPKPGNQEVDQHQDKSSLKINNPSIASLAS